MNKKFIKIPSDIKKLSDGLRIGWDLDQQLPIGDVIVNKVVCGCGMTTFYLENDKPVIIASPRNELIHSKMNDTRINGNGELFFFDRRDYKKIPFEQTKNEMMEYLNSHSSRPKILMTYDSLAFLLDKCPDFRAAVRDFIIVIDEFTSLFTDALMKGDEVFKLVKIVSSLPNRVIYISATPIDDTYLDEIPEFANLPYVTFDWDSDAIEKVTINKQRMKSAFQKMGEIIDGYRTRGYFLQKIIDDKAYYSTEVAFFVNRVKDIVDIIKKKSLNPKDVRVICSNDENNVASLAKIGIQIDHFPNLEEYKQNVKTYNFITKTAYVGSDFYSDSAMICIFADSNREEMALDISLELPQIIGRCRTESNIFRHDIQYYYRTTQGKYLSPDETTKSEMESEIRRKFDESKTHYSNQLYHSDSYIIGLIADSHKAFGFKKSYLSVINDKIVFNRLVYTADRRALEIKYSQYNSSQSIEGFIQKCGYEVQNIMARGNGAYAQFRQWWDSTHNFSLRMEAYLDFLDKCPDMIENLKADTDIPIKYWKFSTVLGRDVCRANSYKEAALERELQRRQSADNIRIELTGALNPSIVYPAKELKGIIQSVYDKLGLTVTAKATDVTKYFDVEKCDYRITDSNGKIKTRHGFKIRNNNPLFGLSVTTFPRVNQPKESNKDTLGNVLWSIREGATVLGVNLADTINKFRTTKNETYKDALPIVTWQGEFSERSNSHCLALNSVMCMDFDHVPVDILNRLRDLLKDVPFVLAYFLSPSGEGLKVLIKTDLSEVNTTLYRNCYIQLEKWFMSNYELEADPKCRPMSQSCKLSYDPDLYFNPTPADFHFEFDEELEKELTKREHSGVVKVQTYSPKYNAFINKLNVLSHGLNDEDILEILYYRFHATPEYYQVGNRERSIGIQAHTLNQAGIPFQKAIQCIRKNFEGSGFPIDELDKKVENEYNRHGNEFGSCRGEYISRKSYFQQKTKKD